MKELWVLNTYFWKYRAKIMAGIFFVLASNLFRVVQPRIVREAMDKIVFILHQNQGHLENAEATRALHTSLSWFGLTIVCCAILMGIFMYYMRQTIIVVSRLIEYDQRNELYAHFQTLDTAFYKRNKVGDIMSRLVEDVNKVRMYVGPALMYIVNTATMFVMVIYSMLQVSPMLTAWCLAPLPILSFSIYWVSRYINQRSTAVSQQLSSLTSEAQETYSGIRVVKSYAKEAQISRHFAETSANFKALSLEKVQIDAIFMPLVAFLIGISTVLVVYVGGLQTYSSAITTGNIAEFIIYVGMLTWPVASLGWVASLIQTANASQRRINEFGQLKSKITSPTDVKTGVESPISSSNSPAIEFRNVSFVYPDTGILALDNLSFRIEKGSQAAILGKTGSGKTTVMELICRMYDVTDGAVLIDGRDVRTWDLTALRQAIGYVPQDVFLFSDTVRQNINFGMTHTTDRETEQFAAYSAIHDEILSLPQGYDTIVGERGVMLSGGQKQRISLARALLKRPNLLLLDDCLSAIDTQTEQKILSYLNEKDTSKTMLLITHRVHYLTNFDQLIVLEKGKLNAIGKHAVLVNERGYYQDLYEQQVGQYA